MSEEDKGRRRIMLLLYCPSLSNLLQLAVCEDQRIDLGYIATAFGLDPSTLRINGHFIATGIDFISSYLTWNSLFSFFSAKRLSTGKYPASDPLIVHGKLSRLGTKRALDPQDDRSRPEVEDDIVLPSNNKKMREADSDILEKDNNNELSKSISSNRFRCTPMKRTRENDVDEAIVSAPYKKIR
ncbi:hypothetical protein G4B88_003699 [Cannabis sativa]|uniref:Uncharacterized protein n=1 Tax=Cannabis sativa TaxID=3483 RepID=A0A7J6FA46_CANSA|nr:hypothetical protein G4B88_003699 [Cannabis sativa]